MSAPARGKIGSAEVHRLVLANAAMRVAILTYGGVIERLEVPDRDGLWNNVVLGFGDLAGYADNTPYFGALIGRYANRIAQGRFELEGHTYELACNDGPNALHGGRRGFDRHRWALAEAPGRDRIVLALTSPDGDEGFPGRLEVQVAYTLEGPALRIDYTARSDRATVINLTNHSYFNLAGEGAGSVLAHTLAVHADAFTPVNAEMIPTGARRPVAGTHFDFRQSTAIGARIDAADAQLAIGLGYDHNWVLRDRPAAAPAPAASLVDPTSGRRLDILTTQPGLQVYSGNRLDGTIVGPSGASYGRHAGIALETQHFPDSPNQPDFPTTVLRPGETFRSATILRFGVEA